MGKSVKGSAKAKVRMHLKSMHDGDTFTIKGLAEKAGVNGKSVGNTLMGMREFGAITAQTRDGNRNIEYTIVANTLSAYFLKKPWLAKSKANGKLADTSHMTPKEAAAEPTSPKRGRRSPVVMEIDKRILELKVELDTLVAARNILVK